MRPLTSILADFFSRKAAEGAMQSIAPSSRKTQEDVMPLDISAAAQLPPVPPPKVGNKQVTLPSYRPQAKAGTSALPKTDLRAANVDITATYRTGTSTNVIIRNLARVTPDLSAAVAAYLRVGIPEYYTVVARDPDGTFNREATLLAMSILARFELMPDYVNGFSQVASLRSCSEALGKEIMFEGAAALELVLDKSRMPLKFQPVSVSQIVFFEDDVGKRPVQRLGGVDTDLDIPTFFYTQLDASLLDPYAQSPLESAVQSVLASTTFLADLRRVCARHVYPRYDLKINEEKLRERIPQEILLDQNALADYLNTVLSEVEAVINGLAPEEAIIHFDFFDVEYIKGADGDIPNTFREVKETYDAKIATGAKVLPAILGHGSGSQNVASTETMLFMMSANGMIRLKLNELYSKAMTLAVRLFGLDVTVTFKYDPIDLRPDSELEAFKSMKQSRVLEQLSLGFLTDDEAAIELTGQLAPNGFAPLSGTQFFGKAAAPAGNPNSNTDTQGNKKGALNQSLEPKTPQAPKGK